MEAPNVRTSIRDEKNNVTYHVMAYRKLARAEVVQSVRAFQSQPKVRRKKHVKNATITILTLHGATPEL